MSIPYINLIRNVWHHGSPWRGTIIGYYCAYIIAQSALSFSPYAFGRTIEVLQNFNPDQLSAVIFWLSIGIFVLLLFWIFHGPARIKERQVALKIQQSFRIKMYEKLTQLPLRWHQDHHSGNIITRINRASIALHRFAEDQFIYIETIIKFITSIAFLLWISLPVGILSFITCALAVTIVILFDRKLIPLYASQNEIDNGVGAVFFDYVSNMTTILTLRLGKLTRSNLFKRMLKVWVFFRKDVILNEVKWFSMGMLLSILQSIILISYIIVSLKQHDMVMIGLVVMIFRYQWDLSDVFYNVSAYYSELVKMDTDVRGIEPLLKDMARLAHVPKGVSAAKKWQQFTIEHLKFNHGNKEIQHKHFLHDVNFSVKRGDKIALIGSSGGGKSTLLYLLRGVYTPDQVSLIVDDSSFTTLEPLQEITTLIPQDPEIFENTLAFNITLDVAAHSDEILKAVELAGFLPVLQSLPLGLETDIREKGFNLSVGQKQRLALARGLFAARFSSLILMDEPTSSVDLATEKEILTGVINHFTDATIIVSLHRLHLLPKFDHIMMLSQGKIIASGSTHKLLKEPGPVHDLWIKYQE